MASKTDTQAATHSSGRGLRDCGGTVKSAP